MSDFKELSLNCSEGSTATGEEPRRPDAALPFLSLSSGLMLVCALQRLQLGEFGTSSENRWDWDFKSQHQMANDGIRRCRDGCTLILPPSARRKIANATRWRDETWLQPALS